SAGSAQAQAITPAVAAPPTLSIQPTNQTALIGTTAQFTVAAAADGSPMSYLWQKNGIPIADATAASYTTPATTALDNGADFSVVITNGAGNSVTSANAVLTVANTFNYTVHPGFIGTDLNNNTHGVWADSQIYITILGKN